MIKRVIPALLTAICVFVFLGFIADDDPIAKIKQQLDKWADEYSVEKVYLQMDKPYYAAGDDIWFKAYVTNGGQHQLSALSGVLNVELVDELDSVMQLKKLPIANGVSWGDFALPDTLHQGTYRLRAYTNYMRNAGSDYFFDRLINIINPITDKVITKTSYHFNTQDGKTALDATINYSDKNGIAFVGAAVNYSLENDGDIVNRGNGVTDATGNLHLTMPLPKQALGAARIISRFSMPDKEVVSKSIAVRSMTGADVQFFPEGGYMVNGIASKVAFKAVNAEGLGTDIKGVIIDGAGKEVADFASEHLGMGIFGIVPVSGENYRAKIKFADGSEKTIELPKALDQGYVINMSTADADNIRVRITTAQATVAANPGQQLSLVAQSGGRLCYAAKSQPGSAIFSSVIPKSKFPSGIVQFTLFSSTAEPLAERLAFIQNTDQLKLNVSGVMAAGPRQKVKLNLIAKSSADKPVAASFSVAVTDESKVKVDADDENNIFANLLLTSDIKGFIEKPTYYFNNITDKTRADLDILMLTQGYRRFEWKKILADDFKPLIYAPEASLSISGVLLSETGRPVANGKVQLFDMHNITATVDTLTDDKGRFVFKDLIYSDSVRMLVKAKNAKGKSGGLTVQLDKITPAAIGQRIVTNYGTDANATLTVYAQSSKQLYNQQLQADVGNHVVGLKEVVIRDKKTEYKNSQNLNGPGNADEIVGPQKLENLNCVRIADCLRTMFSSVRWTPAGMPYTNRGNMLVVLDGNALEADQIFDIDIRNIQTIEVLSSLGKAAVYGSRGAGGVLVITSKRAGDRGYVPNSYGSGTKAWMGKGFYKARTFYSPAYDGKSNDKLADLRTTVFWKPDLNTDDNGKASFEYFNAGSPGNYRVVIEGVTADGGIGRQVFRYKVE